MATTTDSNHRPTALVVDDHPTTLKIMSAWLEASGYSVRQAVDGTEAWDSAQLECPQLVITDWNMPRMSGLELCRCIRQRHPWHQVYLMVATARDGQEDAMEAMDAGANDFLSKPVNEQEFLARIRRAEQALKQLQLAETDPLTGCCNRHLFDEACGIEIQRARDSGRPLSCIVLDVDLFKHINDNHGHAVGDSVLVTLADVLRRQSRERDTVCRLGGDEFCVLLPDASEMVATRIGRRILSAVRRQRISISGDDVGFQVTLGVAPWTANTTPKELVDRADQVLLTAKNAGRNRVLSQSQLHSGEGAHGDRDENLSNIDKTIAAHVMTPPHGIFSETQSLREALEWFLQASTDCAPVVDQHSDLVGLISERELLNVALSREQWNRPIGDVMTANFARFEETTPVLRIWKCLQRSPMLRVVIVDDGQPTGFVSRKALMRFFCERGMQEVTRGSDR